MTPLLTQFGFTVDDDVIGAFSWTVNDHFRAHITQLSLENRQEVGEALRKNLTQFIATILDNFEKLMTETPSEPQDEIDLVQSMIIETENIGNISWTPSSLVLTAVNDFGRHNYDVYSRTMRQLGQALTDLLAPYVSALCIQTHMDSQCSLNLLNVTFSDN